MLLHSTWIGQTSSPWLNDRYCKHLIRNRENNFCLIVVNDTSTCWLTENRADELKSKRDDRRIKNDWKAVFVTRFAHVMSICIFMKVSYDMQQCLQFKHCEYFMDFWFCIWIAVKSVMNFVPTSLLFFCFLLKKKWQAVFITSPDKHILIIAL